MAAQFDAYHRWLGIPPGEQPPTHYRLLGLVDFESDVEAIRDAVERQIAHVRSRALKHPELSQKILNELAMAKLCLLNPESKAAYDKQLRKIAASKSKAQGPRAPTWAGLSVAQWGVLGGVAAGLGVALGVTVVLLWPKTEDLDRDAPPAAAAAVPAVHPVTEVQQSSGGSVAVASTMPQAVPSKRPPKLAAIADRFAEPGKELILKAELADRGSLGRLCWKLVEGSEWGASIDPDSGRIRWTPQPNQADKKWRFTVEVAPENAADLADRASFQVEVRPAPRLAAAGGEVAEPRQTGLGLAPSSKPSKRGNLETADFARSTAASRRKAPRPAVDLAISSPSGRKLTAADWDVTPKAAKAVEALWSSRDSNVVRLHDLAYCEYNTVTNKLDGRAVTLHRGFPRRCETYVEYRQGNRHGVLANWDAEGRMEYWGEYERDKCHEFCCWFEEDQPRMVLVCDHGKVLAVHLVSEGKVAKSFASEEDAMRDEAARPLLEKIDDFDKRYKKNEVALRAEVKRIVQSLVGQMNSSRRDAALSRIQDRGARQKAGAAAMVEEFRRK